jgi:twitching motility protein PilT
VETSGHNGGFVPAPVPVPLPDPDATVAPTPSAPPAEAVAYVPPPSHASPASDALGSSAFAASPYLATPSTEVSAFGTPAAPVSFAPPATFVPAAPVEAPAPLPVEPEPVSYAATALEPDTSVQVAEDLGATAYAARTSTEEVPGHEEVSLNDLLEQTLTRGASDLHLTTGSRPQIRLHGHLTKLEEYPVMTPQVIQRMLYAAITQKQREKFEEILELDFSYSVPGKARFRVNIYRQRDSLGAAFRLIPYEIKKLEDLGIPPSAANFAMLPRGFVLVTGPTGSGKSTTLASLVDLANRQRRDHIMTVEDPIEFLHSHQSCLVNQREVGEDTLSFTNALKHVLRQDPDIILVGEMRDLETISVALTAAETGHLVFATLHTQDAAQTIDRVIDVFPPHQQQQVRVQLAGTLQGVVCQTLARTTDGMGRAVATEVLVATPAIRNLIREGKTHQIYSAMQAGAQHGMHTMDQHLAELIKRGRITYETGLEKCHHIEDFNRLTGRG